MSLNSVPRKSLSTLLFLEKRQDFSLLRKFKYSQRKVGFTIHSVCEIPYLTIFSYNIYICASFLQLYRLHYQSFIYKNILVTKHSKFLTMLESPVIFCYCYTQHVPINSVVKELFH